MSWFSRIIGKGDQGGKVDYQGEAQALLESGQFHDALTSFRLALKESPGDPVILQQIAITYTRIGMTDEAVKTYRHVLQRDPEASGAHYGLAFILLRRGERVEAAQHLEAFLRTPSLGLDDEQHRSHAQATLAALRGDEPESPHEIPVFDRGQGEDRHG